jgi:two-component system, NtrC family, response regulator AtoC
VSVNCAALPSHLLESELFGHEKGVFTDARSLKRGLLELAHGGTIFLDEIGALPLELQGKLLLFLEEREIRRVGGTDTIPISTHIIAATNEELTRRVEERTFRADLLFRLDVAAIELPALRDMPEVIPQLAARFAHEICSEARIPVPPLDDQSFAHLDTYSWPGNARELRNAVERSLIFRDPGPLRVYPPRLSSGRRGGAPEPTITLPLDLPLGEVEERYVRRVLEARGETDLKTVAEQLGISRKSLWEKRKRWGLEEV